MDAAADSRSKAIEPPVAILTALRLGVTLIFAFAAFGKLLDLPGLQRSLSELDWIPTAFLLPSALALILAELSIAFLLWPQRTARVGAVLAGVLSGAFALYTADRLVLGASSDCPCFGIFLKLNPWLMLLIDSALFAASLEAFRLSRSGELSVPAVVQPASNGPSLRLPLLAGTLLLCLCGFFRVLPDDPLLRMRISSFLDFSHTPVVFSPITPAMLKGDPPMLAKLPVPNVQGFDPHKPTFMVFATGCSLCSLGGIMAADQAREGGDNVVVVSPSPVAEMRKFMSDHQLRVFVFSDPNNRYYKAYNLSFRTRVYLLDSSRRLVWKQDAVRADPGEMTKAAEDLMKGAAQ